MFSDEVKLVIKNYPLKNHKFAGKAAQAALAAKVQDKFCRALDSRLDGAIEKLRKLEDFQGKEGSFSIIYGTPQVAAKRIMLVGLGEKKKATVDTVRKAACLAANKAVSLKAKSICLALHKATGGRFALPEVGRVCAEGAHYGSYRYDEFITDSEDGRLDTLAVELIDSDSVKITKLKNGFSAGTIIGNAQSYARTLANRPGNVINPAALAAEAKSLAKGIKNLSCTVFNEKQLK